MSRAEVRKIAAARDILSRKLAALILDFENSTGMQIDGVTVRRASISTPLGRKRRELSVLLSIRLGDTNAPTMTLAGSADDPEDALERLREDATATRGPEVGP